MPNDVTGKHQGSLGVRKGAGKITNTSCFVEFSVGQGETAELSVVLLNYTRPNKAGKVFVDSDSKTVRV